nr:hypothetical protein [Tanacetum cinerariifolium]
GVKGHYKRDCPKLKNNNNQGNQGGRNNAPAREVEDKSKEKRLEDVPVVRDFPEVASADLRDILSAYYLISTRTCDNPDFAHYHELLITESEREMLLIDLLGLKIPVRQRTYIMSKVRMLRVRTFSRAGNAMNLVFIQVKVSVS